MGPKAIKQGQHDGVVRRHLAAQHDGSTGHPG
jgi:hypothetical protein